MSPEISSNGAKKAGEDKASHSADGKKKKRKKY